MYRKLLEMMVGAGVIGAILATLAGFLAIWLPSLDLINHFRPFLLAGSAGLAVLAFLLRLNRTALYTSATVCFINLFLMVVAWSYASSVSGSGQALASGPTIKLISYNILFNNNNLESARGFLEKEAADVVVFQEFRYRHKPLLESLKALYPHQITCIKPPVCGLAMASRYPLEEPRTVYRNSISPSTISARLTDQSGKAFRVIGTHIAWPLHAYKQKQDMNWLAGYVSKSKIPTIVLGDFNHTPWSWRLTRFAHATGMKRHGTFANSWPSSFPTFLIDHVFSTRQILNLETRVGPDLNSDHLPIISKITIK